LFPGGGGGGGGGEPPLHTWPGKKRGGESIACPDPSENKSSTENWKVRRKASPPRVRRWSERSLANRTTNDALQLNCPRAKKKRNQEREKKRRKKGEGFYARPENKHQLKEEGGEKEREKGTKWQREGKNQTDRRQI